MLKKKQFEPSLEVKKGNALKKLEESRVNGDALAENELQVYVRVVRFTIEIIHARPIKFSVSSALAALPSRLGDRMFWQFRRWPIRSRSCARAQRKSRNVYRLCMKLRVAGGEEEAARAGNHRGIRHFIAPILLAAKCSANDAKARVSRNVRLEFQRTLYIRVHAHVYAMRMRGGEKERDRFSVSADIAH